jgi:hypothetical protein
MFFLWAILQQMRGLNPAKLLNLTIHDRPRSINPSKEGFSNSWLGFFSKVDEARRLPRFVRTITRHQESGGRQ